MTELEWLHAATPQPMLEYLGATGKLSARKARLFAVACCRRIWHLLTDERSRRGVDVAELFADGIASSEELDVACVAAWDAVEGEVFTAVGDTIAARAAVWPATQVVGTDAALDTAWDAVLAVVLGCAVQVEEATRHQEHAAQADLLRCITGPVAFRARPSVPPSVLRWNDRTVPHLAQAMRVQRDFSSPRMNVLADALEEAGCTNDDILGHCRQAVTPHVHGCWVVDLVVEPSAGVGASVTSPG